MLKLIFKNNEREAFELKQGRNSLGRNAANSVVLNAGGVSDYHAEIQVDGETAVLVDLASTNGTYLNGKRINTRTPLKSFDVIRIDVVEIEVVDPAKRRPTAVRAAVTDADLAADKDATRARPGVGAGAAQGRDATGPGSTVVMPSLSARLVLIGEPSPGKSFPLQGSAMTVGRVHGNRIVIDDTTVSSHHAEIVRDGAAWRILDKGSTNGTFVNGKRTASAMLKHGDAVALGKVALRFEDPASGSGTGTVTMATVDAVTKTSVQPVVAAARIPTWAYSLIGFAVVAVAIGGYMFLQGQIGFGKPAQIEAMLLQASKLWEQSLGSRTGPTTPALGDINGDGVLDVVLADSQGYVLALDGQEGKKIFEVEVADKILAPPVLGDINGDGKLDVIVATSSGVIHTFDGQGKTIWKSSPSLQLGGIFNRPVLVDVNGDGVRDVIVPTEKKGLVAIDGARGWDHELWNTQGMMRGSVVTSPLVADINGDGVMDFVVATDAGQVIAVSSQQGKVWQLWEQKVPEVLYASPALIDAGKQKLVVIATKGEGIVALVAGTGRVAWRTPIAKPFFASPVVADVNGDGVPDVLAVAEDGTVFALNGLTGDEIWSLALGVTVQASPALFDVDNDGVRDLVVLDGNGSIRVVSAVRGREVLNVPISDSGGFVASPVLGDLDKDSAGILKIVAAIVSGRIRAGTVEIVAAGVSGRISAYSLNRLAGRGEAVWPVFLGNDAHAVK
jgi:pSer/pThr/pTyr-binding forkhead associated (FHA) protein/outer membrane protein assembly factor BamB